MGTLKDFHQWFPGGAKHRWIGEHIGAIVQDLLKEHQFDYDEYDLLLTRLRYWKGLEPGLHHDEASHMRCLARIEEIEGERDAMLLPFYELLLQECYTPEELIERTSWPLISETYPYTSWPPSEEERVRYGDILPSQILSIPSRKNAPALDLPPPSGPRSRRP